jgi:3-methyladenine DNA glycosylase AlkD
MFPVRKTLKTRLKKTKKRTRTKKMKTAMTRNGPRQVVTFWVKVSKLLQVTDCGDPTR